MAHCLVAIPFRIGIDPDGRDGNSSVPFAALEYFPDRWSTDGNEMVNRRK
jgi:hypothetical protein